MPKWTTRREAFRAILAGDTCVRPASVHDPVSARIAEDLGFELGMFAGSVASLTVLGAPDHIVLTLTEFADQAHRINRAAKLPVLVDADHGYGNALNVMRTVEELETAGVAGLSIEDTELPQPFASGGQARLIPVEEGVGKMRAALEARTDPSLVIAGRSSAAGIAGVEEAIRRATAYEAAGVDAIFLVGVKSVADLEAIAGALRTPLIIGGGGAGVGDHADLAALGVRVSLQGHQPFAAAVQAIHATMKALREGTPPGALSGVASRELMRRVMRDDEYADRIARFLG